MKEGDLEEICAIKILHPEECPKCDGRVDCCAKEIQYYKDKASRIRDYTKYDRSIRK